MTQSTPVTEPKLSGAELEQGLIAGKFAPPPARLTGMVKQSEKPGHIAFTPSGCDSWVDLPSAMIATAEQVGHQVCRDHSHPLFALTLIEPEDAAGKVLLALLHAREAQGADPVGALLGNHTVHGDFGDHDFDDHGGGGGDFETEGDSAPIFRENRPTRPRPEVFHCTGCICTHTCGWVYEKYKWGYVRVRKCETKCTNCRDCKKQA